MNNLKILNANIYINIIKPAKIFYKKDKIMKKFLFLSIAALLLTACGGGGGNNVSDGSSTGGGSTHQSQSDSNSSGGPAKLCSRISLPENVKIVSTFDGTYTSESYKIGNKFMLVCDTQTYCYAEFNETTGIITMVTGYKLSGQLTWNDTKMETSLVNLYGQAYQEFVVEYENPNSYFSKYMAKSKETSESKEIVGKTCVKYYDNLGPFTNWVEKSSMLCFEEDNSGYISTVSEFNTSITSFPETAPTL